MQQWKVVTMKMGSNNARHVVWGLGEPFIYFFIFFDANSCLLSVYVVYYELHDGGRQLQWKQAQTMQDVLFEP